MGRALGLALGLDLGLDLGAWWWKGVVGIWGVLGGFCARGGVWWVGWVVGRCERGCGVVNVSLD